MSFKFSAELRKLCRTQQCLLANCSTTEHQQWQRLDLQQLHTATGGCPSMACVLAKRWRRDLLKVSTVKPSPHLRVLSPMSVTIVVTMGSVVAWPWLFQTWYFRSFSYVAILYPTVRNTICLLSDSYSFTLLVACGQLYNKAFSLGTLCSHC